MPQGQSVRWDWGRKFPAQAQYALCRCGGSATKPYCDGTHAKLGFDGTETASRKSYREQAKVIVGPALSLTDAESLCAFARFCDPNGQVWTLVKETDHADGEAEFRPPNLRLPLGAPGRVGQCDGRADRAALRAFHRSHRGSGRAVLGPLVGARRRASDERRRPPL